MSYYGTGFFTGTSRNSGWYSNWAGVRNGSYGRTVNSYYSGLRGSDTAASGRRTSTSTGKEYVLDKLLREKMYPTVSRETQEANAKLTSEIPRLASSVSVLQNKKTYQDTTGKTDASAKVVSAMKNYVSEYNEVVRAAKGSTLTNKTAHIGAMMNATRENKNKLAELGITVSENGILQLNEDKLKAADISKVQELFSKDNVMSYGSIVKSRLGFAGASSGTVAGTHAVVGTHKEKHERDRVTRAGTKNLMEDIEKFTADDAFLKPYSKKDVRKAFREIDIAGIYATTKSFVNHYNSLIDAAKGSTNSGVTSNLAALMEKTEQNKDSLKQFGIDVDENGNMKLDEDRLRKGQAHSSISIERFFKNYASSISNNVSLIDYYMKTQAGAASGYVANGSYNVQGNSLFDIAV